MSLPEVTVITTVRNAMPFLKETLRSIRIQSETALEIIVVDDGSSDDTLQFLQAMSSEDSRIRISSNPNPGRGRALNMAIEMARAPFIANIDADDPSHPRRIELQLAAMRQHPELAVLDAATIFIKGGVTPDWPVLGNPNPAVFKISQRLAYHNPVNHSAVLMRADALRAVGGYDETRQRQFDYDLWVRLVGAGYGIGHLPITLASKRLHAGQSFERRKRLRYVISSAHVQARAIRIQRTGPRAWSACALRIVWGALPAAARIRLYGRARRAWEAVV